MVDVNMVMFYMRRYACVLLFSGDESEFLVCTMNLLKNDE